MFEASKQQCRVVLGLSPYDFEELVEIQPQACSYYVLSASEPFNEEMEIDFKRLANWLDHYGLPQYHVHVSGHIIPLQLKSLLREMDAAKVFPSPQKMLNCSAGSCETLKEKWSSSRKEKRAESKAIPWSIHQTRKSEVDFEFSAEVDDRAMGQATGYLSHDHQSCTFACPDFNGQLAV